MYGEHITLAGKTVTREHALVECVEQEQHEPRCTEAKLEQEARLSSTLDSRLG